MLGGRIGPLELGILVVIVLIIFGVGKLPQVGGAVGKGIREFKDAVGGKDERREESKEQVAVKSAKE